ncbi:SDR family NAD(P)-dependent oxidoreductase [Nocardiopsis terrae]
MSALNVLVTGASTGVGRLSARTLAGAGHTVHASMPDATDHDAENAAAARRHAQDNEVDLRTADLNITRQGPADSAMNTIITAHDRVDVVVRDVGHGALGPAEAFTPGRLVGLSDTNLIGAHRVNRAALPRMRRSRPGPLVCVGSTTSRVVHPVPGPYRAVKTAFGTLSPAARFEVARYGIEPVTVVPGPVTEGAGRCGCDAQAVSGRGGLLRDTAEAVVGSDVPGCGPAGHCCLPRRTTMVRGTTGTRHQGRKP